VIEFVYQAWPSERYPLVAKAHTCMLVEDSTTKPSGAKPAMRNENCPVVNSFGESTLTLELPPERPTALIIPHP
jgi:hypothetical protein